MGRGKHAEREGEAEIGEAQQRRRHRDRGEGEGGSGVESGEVRDLSGGGRGVFEEVRAGVGADGCAVRVRDGALGRETARGPRFWG